MGPKSENVENVHVLICFFERARGAFSGDKREGSDPKKEAFQENFLCGGWQNNAPQRGREAYFQEIGLVPYGNIVKFEGSLNKT